MALAKELVGAHLPASVASAIGGQVSSISAAGTNQGTATPVASSLVTVGSASGSNGVILPAVEVGDSIKIYSSAATNALLVYPPSGAAINAASANAAYSQAAQTAHIYTCVSSTQWIVV